MSADVLLINPPYISSVFEGREESGDVSPPLGVAYIASSLRKHNINVEILDANALGYTTKQTIEEIKKRKADIIGLTSTTITVPVMNEIVDNIKTKENLTVAGGVHVSSLPEDTLKKNKNIDIIVISEGEETMLDIVHEFNNNKKWNSIPGIAYRSNKKIIRTKERELIKDIDSLPFPARDLLPMDKYRPGPIMYLGIKGEYFGTLLTTRGCTAKCVYCSSAHFWKCLRMRSAKNVIEELRFLKKKYGIKQFMIVDDNFTASKKRLLEICSELKKMKLSWFCFSRVSNVDREMLHTMKKAGCFLIFYGIESGNQEVLNKINKNITLEQAEKAVKLTKKEGIIVNCSFMLGLPYDTKETMQQTLDFAKKINPHIAEFYITTPFPGTKLNEIAIKHGWIKQNNNDWSNYSVHRQNVLKTSEFDPKEVEAFVKKCYQQYYLRPRFLLLSIKKVVTWPKAIVIYYNCLKIFLNLIIKNHLP